MQMPSHRVEILLDGERHTRLIAAAERRGVPVAVIVREAIDRALPRDADERAAAARRILAADPMELPSPGKLRDELEALRSRRA